MNRQGRLEEFSVLAQWFAGNKKMMLRLAQREEPLFHATPVGAERLVCRIVPCFAPSEPSPPQ
jgi:hypothetical protein